MSFDVAQFSVGATPVKLADFAGQHPCEVNITLSIQSGSISLGGPGVSAATGIPLLFNQTPYTLSAHVADGDALYAVENGAGPVSVQVMIH